MIKRKPPIWGLSPALVFFSFVQDVLFGTVVDQESYKEC